MTLRIPLAALALLAALPARAQAPRDDKASAAPPALVIKAGHLIDGLAGEPRGASAVLIREGRIAAVGAPEAIAAQAPAGAQVIDLGDAWLLPGMVDAHPHALL